MEFYNKHYILLDGENRIIDGWSNGPLAGKDTEDAICINEQGGYQFRLFPDGEENPALIDSDGVHLWKYDDKVLATTEEEREAERASFPVIPPQPSADEKIAYLEARLEATETLLTDTQMALCEQYEANLALQDEVTNTQLALCEVYELMA